MTVLEHAPQGELSDAELISAVRGGDVSAYGDLFARHREAATRLARQLVSNSDADDLVSEAFAKVLNVLLAGGGPDVAFRAYLLTAVRRLHVDKIRATNRAMPTDDLSPYDQGEPFNDTVLSGFEGGAAARAYASLPERWQLVLWHLEVEGQKPAEVAPLLGMTPNSVSALAYRAREGLRQAYLQMHSADIADSECQWVHDRLGAYVRKGLSRRDSAKVEEHLRSCRKCTALFLELSEVNSSMAGVIGPVVLGTATMGYLGAAAPAGLWGGVWGGLIAAFGTAKEAVAANAKVAVGIGAAAGVAGIATVAVLVANNSGTQRPPQVEPSPGISTSITPPPVTQPPKPTRTPTPTPQQNNTGGGTTPVVFHPPTPTPTSEPTKSPTQPPFTPPPTQPPVTPPPTSADVSVDLSFQAKLGLLGAKDAGTIGNLTAVTDGVPDGMKGTLTIQTLGATLEQLGTGCTVDGATTTCPIWKNMPPLVFKMMGVPVSTSATVSGPTNVTDPSPRNNTASVLLGLLAFNHTAKSG
ncbi:sigma-70 family RNA polymerase sigma factor [Nocardioides marmorisolisilvae]|uniref:Sigma-70 family RNA polymerase sigma factor n=1 Tax=Nocardioides marmorisolisilvae TaxID=1542737 RepID=A0A3N0DX56_9ACTN|nr:sigma-70 family RNA polymerase sigma factor [Nocardioides marmorisolisilvae]RNL80076.1 sigma-70 family RNA polymerase sigma factor [Nocardioides marmorisolisilvae]